MSVGNEEMARRSVYGNSSATAIWAASPGQSAQVDLADRILFPPNRPIRSRLFPVWLHWLVGVSRFGSPCGLFRRDPLLSEKPSGLPELSRNTGSSRPVQQETDGLSDH